MSSVLTGAGKFKYVIAAPVILVLIVSVWYAASRLQQDRVSFSAQLVGCEGATVRPADAVTERPVILPEPGMECEISVEATIPVHSRRMLPV